MRLIQSVIFKQKNIFRLFTLISQTLQYDLGLSATFMLMNV